jgi:hypothetical protein
MVANLVCDVDYRRLDYTTTGIADMPRDSVSHSA